jgi:hypothetical protein
MKEINRLKVVPVEQKRTGKWLAEALGKNEAVISRWCTKLQTGNIRPDRTPDDLVVQVMLDCKQR